jgi:hypothetical protein
MNPWFSLILDEGTAKIRQDQILKFDVKKSFQKIGEE